MLGTTRNASVVARYYLYRAVAGPGFIWPIYVLYLRSHGLSYAAIGTIGAVQTVVVVGGEIPTGWVGDRVGRRNSLVAAQVVFVASAVGMVLAGTFAGFAASFGLLSLAMTFVSGSSDAWLYEVLQERLDEDAFTHVKGRGAAIGQWVTALTMVAGSLMYVVVPVAPFVALVASRLLTLLVVLTLPKTARYADETGDAAEADDESSGESAALSALDAPRVIREHLARPPLRPFVVYTGLFVATAVTAGLYIQPVTVDALQGSVGAWLAAHDVPEAATLGLLYAAFTGASAVASDRASDLEDRLGVRGSMLVVPLVVAVLLVVPVAVPLLAFPMFFALRGGQAVLRPIAGQYLNDHLADVGRATVLSAVSMAYALFRVPFMVGSGVVADASTPLVATAVVGAAFLVVGGAVFLLREPVREETDARGAGVAAD